MHSSLRSHALFGFCTLVILIVLIVVFSDFDQKSLLSTWDDYKYVEQDGRIHTLNVDNLIRIFSEVYFSNYHPLTTLSYALDYQLYGFNPEGYRWTNLVLHLLNFLVFIVLAHQILRCSHAQNERTIRLFTALFAATLFALHPQRLEVVAWVSQRKELLCTLFYLLTLYMHLQYNTAQSGRRLYGIFRLVAAIGAFLSKPMSISLPLALLILDFFPLKKISPNQWRTEIIPLLVDKIPFFLLSILILLIHLQGQNIAPLSDVGFSERLQLSAFALLFYPFNAIVLGNTQGFYPVPMSIAFSPDMAWGWVVAAILLLVGLLFLSIKKQWLGLTAATLFYLITVFPVLGIVRVGQQGAADRYAYLPLLGLTLCMAWVIIYLLIRFQNRVLRILVFTFIIGVVGILGITTHSRLSVWNNDIALWESVMARHPNHTLVYRNLATAYEIHGSVDESLSTHDKLLSRLSQQPHLLALPSTQDHFDLYEMAALSFLRNGREAEGLSLLGLLVNIAPENVGYLYDYVDSLFQVGRIEEAMQALSRLDSLVKKQQNNLSPSLFYYLLAYIHYRLGDFMPSLSLLERLHKLDKDHVEGWYIRAAIAQEQEQLQQALDVYQKILQIAPREKRAQKQIEVLQSVLSAQ